ncbi:MAG: hypothetical protein IKP88_17635 [Lachnospiraceae bacterium]|nr:hypothetical protein [Lachnospiraceae bacterium]
MNYKKSDRQGYIDYDQLENIYPTGTVLIHDIDNLKKAKKGLIKPIAVLERAYRNNRHRETIVSFKDAYNYFADRKLEICRVKANNSFFLDKGLEIEENQFFSFSYIGKIWDMIMMIKNYQPGMDFNSIFMYYIIKEKKGVVEFYGVSIRENIQPLIKGQFFLPVSISSYLKMINRRLNVNMNESSIC